MRSPAGRSPQTENGNLIDPGHLAAPAPNRQEVSERLASSCKPSCFGLLAGSTSLDVRRLSTHYLQDG
jgi:hypothetical protein